MSVNREQLKRMIDQIPEKDALEVRDFIEFLNVEREKEMSEQLEVEYLAADEDLIRQVNESREDRRNGRIYNKEQGLKYLRKKTERS